MIPFNRPFEVGTEIGLVQQAMASGHLSGHGHFSNLCELWIQERMDAEAVLLTPSCSSALEMAVILAGVEPGDEVIMPSYTFVSTANAVVLRGGVPVFVDIDPETLNVDENRIAEAITEKTRAIIVVHYGGVAAKMHKIAAVADAAGVLLIEDAAHCVRTSLNGRELGSFGALATLSFHETKNVQCGEGGALVVNQADLVERAKVIQDKGTNRSEFLLGQADKYTWVDVGSSFLPNELSAAFLYAQLEAVDSITEKRLSVWHRYWNAFSVSEWKGDVGLPVIPPGCMHNGHLFYLILPSPESRGAFIEKMKANGVQTVFHYIPLHSSPAGHRMSRVHGSLENTDRLSERLVRLPIWPGMTDEQVERVITSSQASLVEVVG